jgi:hypothetical protein
MPGPRDSSIFTGASSPVGVLDWARFARSEANFFRIRAVLRGLPHGWLRSVEILVKRAERAGIAVQDPLNYRLASLINGTINLVEAKYLSDVFENSLRHAFVQHALQHGIEWPSIAKAVPEVSRFDRRVKLGPYAVRDAVLEMTSYQLTESMARHWKRIRGERRYIPGFRFLFWSSQRCRDVNLFRDDSSTIRGLRNQAAHCKGLVGTNEVRDLMRICFRWLKPLNVDVSFLVGLYRSKRPQFLSQTFADIGLLNAALSPPTPGSRARSATRSRALSRPGAKE